MEKINTNHFSDEANEKIADYLGWKLISKDKWEILLTDCTSITTNLQFHENIGHLMWAVQKIVTFEFEDGENAYFRTFGMINVNNGDFMFRINRHQVFQAPLFIDGLYLAVLDFINNLK